MNTRIKDLLEQVGVKYVTLPKGTVYEKFAELVIRDVLAQVEEIQRLDKTLKNKVGIDFQIDVAAEVLKNYGLRSGFCACCGAPAGTPCDASCVWS